MKIPPRNTAPTGRRTAPAAVLLMSVVVLVGETINPLAAAATAVVGFAAHVIVGHVNRRGAHS